MKNSETKLLVTGLLVLLVVLLGLVVGIPQVLDRSKPMPPDVRLTSIRGPGAQDAFDKLAPELLALYEQFNNNTRGDPDEEALTGFTPTQLTELFGIVSSKESNPIVGVTIRSSKNLDEQLLSRTGATPLARTSNTVYALIPIKNVGELASQVEIKEIGVLKSSSLPSPTQRTEVPDIRPIERGAASTSSQLANVFDKQLLTGKGVVVGVIDSGIDWSHEDFRKPDGKSRIIAIWDLTDDSYQSSSGSIGSKPPVYLESSKKWLGTVYTNSQINSALAGAGTVNSVDKSGHGTAVAGTAVSNGRATGNGVVAGTYSGVAPDAELIVVKAMDCSFFSPVAAITADWIIGTAKTLGRSVVVNMSFGGHFSSHDGTEESERFIDSLVGPGKPGAVVTIAAGNDGRHSIRADGKFAPKRKGQADQFSDPIDLQVKSPAELLGVFDKGDEWGLAFRSSNPIFQGADGKMAPIFIYRNGPSYECESTSALANTAQFSQFCAAIRPQFANPTSTNDKLQIKMPSGSYVIWGFGVGTSVRNGRFDLYLTERASGAKASFGMGTQKTGIVSSPGNARNAITIGSYDFRGSWMNRDGEMTLYNLLAGQPSAYSSSGFRRDGVVKPDLLAPGRYTISPLSSHAKLNAGGCVNSMATGESAHFTKDGYHLAWEGTSAVTPFVTGVIVLMLQKNPSLDAEQIRGILKKTARSGGAVGAVPNPVSGWGMIDPAAALRLTPKPANKQR